MTGQGKIKILIVGGSAGQRLRIAHALNSDSGMQVVGMGSNGREAIRFLAHGRPDIIVMAVHMPEMGGLEAARQIMETRPTPIILLTDSRVAQSDPVSARQLADSGAVACIEMPHKAGPDDMDPDAAQLLQTVRLMSEVKVVRRWPRIRTVAQAAEDAAKATSPGRWGIDVVGIGASTGGPPVLKTILQGLPRDFSLPLLVVQHIAPGFIGGLVDWLNQGCNLNVQLGAQGITPAAGHVYLAPDGFHMELAPDGTIALLADELETGLRPSISRLFRSLARRCGPTAVGVLLTGMGKDGAEALKRMKERGATTIAQDRQSSVVHGMAGEAIAIGAATYVLPASAIAPALVSLTASPQQIAGGNDDCHARIGH